MKVRKGIVRNILSILVFGFSVGQIIFNLWQKLARENLIDFTVYWRAIEVFLKGVEVYRMEGIPFNYPPSTLLILLPLKIFPLKTAEVLLTSLSLLSLWLSLWLVLKISKTKMLWWHFLIILAFFTQTFPVKFTLVLGQINLLVLGLAMGGLYLWTNRTDRSKKTGRGVISLSLAGGLKIFPLFTLPLFFLAGSLWFAIGVLTLFLGFNLPSFTLFREYFLKVLPSFSAIAYPNFYNQSIAAFFIRLTGNLELSRCLSFALIGLLYCYLLFLFVKKDQRSACQRLKPQAMAGRLKTKSLPAYFYFILALFSIGNPFSWQHHLVFCYPLIFYLYLRAGFAEVGNENFFVFKPAGVTPASGKPKNFCYLPAKLIFLGVWFLLFFHFPNETSSLLKNPFIASYQTIAILFVLGYFLWRESQGLTFSKR